MTCILVTVWHHHTSHREYPGTSLPFHQSQIRRNTIPEIPNKRQQVCIDGKYCSNCKSRGLHTSTLQCFSWLDSYRQKNSHQLQGLQVYQVWLHGQQQPWSTWVTYRLVLNMAHVPLRNYSILTSCFEVYFKCIHQCFFSQVFYFSFRLVD